MNRRCRVGQAQRRPTKAGDRDGWVPARRDAHPTGWDQLATRAPSTVIRPPPTTTEITVTVTANASDVQVHFTLGVMLASERQYVPAQLELEKANALQPETFEILHNLGQAYLRSEEYSKAEAVLNRALKAPPPAAGIGPE